jgi:hypothetical protein
VLESLSWRLRPIRTAQEVVPGFVELEVAVPA